MDAFWKWLMKANAKGVFIASIVAFLIIGGFWTWKLARPPTDPRSAPANIKRERVRTALGLMAYIDGRLTNAAALPAADPFKNPAYVPPSAPPPPSTNVASTTKPPVSSKPPVDTKPPVKATASSPPSPPPPLPPPRPPPETIVFTYKGTLERPDGRVVALIHDSKQKKASFYSLRETILDFQLRRIEAGSVELVSAKGDVVPLRMGEPFTFTREAPP